MARTRGRAYKVDYDYLRKELSVAESRCIGRFVVGSALAKDIDALRSLNSPSLSVYPRNNLGLIYLYSYRLSEIRQNGISSSELKLDLPDDSSLLDVIHRPEDLLEAINGSRRINQTTANQNLPVPVLTVKGEHKKGVKSRARFEFSVIVGDKRDDYYSEGTTLRGERNVLGPIDNPNFVQSKQGNHKIRLLEADIHANPWQNERHVSAYLGQVIGKELTLGPVAIGLQP
jgi:hypothetical protein